MRKFLGVIADYIRETDKLLLFLCVATSLYGSVLVLSSTYYSDGWSRFFVQLGGIFIGVVFAIVLSKFDYGNIAKFWPILAIAAFLLFAATYFFGYTPENTDNKAWIALPGNMSLQPSELIKLAFIFTFAKHITYLQDEINRVKNVLLLCLHGIIPIALVHFLQNDDGTAIIFAFIFISMMVAAGIKARYFAIAGITAAAVSPVIWFLVLKQYQRDRFLLLFNPEADLLGDGWQQWRARIAISSGGLTGQGLFNGTHVQSGVLPKAYNDFIFATAGEELGFFGCLAIIILLGAICVRILRVGSLSRDKMGMLICVGVFAIFAAQSIINIGMNLSLLPVVGVTLPLFSSGGTSVACLYGGVGMVLSVFMNRHKRTIFLNE